MNNQTENKRYLFRGFRPDKPYMTLVGKDAITLNGQVLHGEWVKGYLKNANTIDTYREMEIDGQICEVLDYSSVVIPETIGQWVTTDKCGNDIFEGEIVKCKHTIYRTFETEESALSRKKPRNSYGHKVKQNMGFGLGSCCPMYDIEYWRNYEVLPYDGKKLGVKIKNGSDVHWFSFSYIFNHDIEVIGNKWEVEQ